MGKRILIIDDEQDMQIYLRTLLKKAGYEPLLAADGEEGLRAARAERPDLITMDLLMPRQSGVLAYDALGELAETRDIPVIIISGIPERTELFGAATARSAGRRQPAAIFDKPIDRDAFLSKVRQLLGE